MDQKLSFENLGDFFGYIDNCPLCKKRLVSNRLNFSLISKTDILKTRLFSSYVSIYNDRFDEIRIDIKTNEIIYSSFDQSIFPTYNIPVINMCAKNHFLYEAEFSIHDSKIISSLNLTKVHTSIYKRPNNFTIIANIKDNQTTIRISNPPFKQHSIILNSIDSINFLSKKDMLKSVSNLEFLL